MAVSIGPRLGIDGEKEYRDSINQIIQQAKTLGSEMKLVTASFDENTEAEEKAQRTFSTMLFTPSLIWRRARSATHLQCPSWVRAH